MEPRKPHPSSAENVPMAQPLPQPHLMQRSTSPGAPPRGWLAPEASCQPGDPGAIEYASWLKLLAPPRA